MKNFKTFEELCNALHDALVAHKDVDVYSYIGPEKECKFQLTDETDEHVEFNINFIYDLIKTLQRDIMYQLHDGEYDKYDKEKEEITFDAEDDINVVFSYHWCEEFLYEHLCIFWDSNIKK